MMSQIVAVTAWMKKHHDLVGALAIVLATTCAYGVGKARGASKAHAEDAAAATVALQKAESYYREKENAFVKDIADLRVAYTATVAEAKAVDAQVARDLGSGAVKLRLPVASRCPSTPAPGAPAGRANGVETAELAPATARSLYSIAAQGDAAIEQLIALQVWAQQAVKLCNGGKP
jgi:hypothetical protein